MEKYLITYQLDGLDEGESCITSGSSEEDAIENMKVSLRAYYRDDACLEHDEAYNLVETLVVLDLKKYERYSKTRR